MLASELYAISQGTKCVGPDFCHWCAAPCERKWQHDDTLPEPFLRNQPRLPAKRPGNHYICAGCRLFRRPRITVNFLSGGYLDRQCPVDHGWWITPSGALALRFSDYPALQKLLEKPPCCFCLILRDGSALPTYLQLASVNDQSIITATTPLAFTLNNIAHVFTTYEIEKLKADDEANGCEPGSQALVKILGIPRTPRETPEQARDAKRGRGRPTTEESAVNQLRKIVRTSGQG